MKVVLKSLELSNYRNIANAHYDFDGNSKIVGENRIGKTNTLEAIVWLLTDKLLNGSSDVASIKPLNDTRAQVRVEGIFEVFDEHNPQIPPKTISIRKEYGEDWVKTRGTDELVFKGHYLKYYYNGVLQKTQRDFNALFKEDFGIKEDSKTIDLIQMLINPFYLGDMGDSDKWKDLRQLIISLIGDVSDDDVFANEPTLMPIKSDLNLAGGRIDQLKKKYTNDINSIEEQLLGIDGMIKALEETPSPADTDVAVAKKGIDDIDEEIAALREKKASNNTSAAVVDIDNQINSLNGKINEINRKDLLFNPGTILKGELEKLNDRYHDLIVKKTSYSSTDYTSRIELIQTNIEKCNKVRTECIEKLRELDEKIFAPFEAICPVCHRPLEGDDYINAKGQYIEKLHLQKEEVYARGRENKTTLNELNETLKSLQHQQEMAKEGLANVQVEISEVLAKIEDTKKKIDSLEPTAQNPEIISLQDEIAKLEEQKKRIRIDSNALNVPIDEKINVLMEERVKYQEVLNNYSYYKRNHEKADSIKSSKKDLEKTLASTEQRKELINQFMKVKLAMLDENVSRVFGNIKFQLIKENINGGYDQVCKPYIYDVEKDASTTVTWRNGSKSERVITGVAICERIKAALELSDLPFLFDEGGEISTETFNTKFKTNAQLICVKVMDNIESPMIMKI